MTMLGGAYLDGLGLKKDLVLLGYNGDADLAGFEVIAPNAAFQQPAAATALKVSSGDADDADADTGARTVQIVGLDAAGAVITETVTMNGTTQVTTVLTTFAKVLSAKVLTAGSSGTNEGIIYVYTGTATAGVPDDLTLVYAHIAAGRGETQQAGFVVPAGMQLDLTAIDIVISPVTVVGQVELQVWSAAGVLTKHMMNAASGSLPYKPWRLPMKLTAGQSVALAVKSAADNAVIAAVLAGTLSAA